MHTRVITWAALVAATIPAAFAAGRTEDLSARMVELTAPPSDGAFLVERSALWRAPAPETVATSLAYIEALRPDMKGRTPSSHKGLREDPLAHTKSERLAFGDGAWRLRISETLSSGTSIVTDRVCMDDECFEVQLVDGEQQYVQRTLSEAPYWGSRGALLDLERLGQVVDFVLAYEPETTLASDLPVLRFDLSQLAMQMYGAKLPCPPGYVAYPGHLDVELLSEEELRFVWRDRNGRVVETTQLRREAGFPWLRTERFLPGTDELVFCVELTPVQEAEPLPPVLAELLEPGDLVDDHRSGTLRRYVVEADGTLPEDAELTARLESVRAEEQSAPVHFAGNQNRLHELRLSELESELDLGVLPIGGENAFRARVTNDLDTTLLLDKVVPKCGCGKVVLASARLAPGETTMLSGVARLEKPEPWDNQIDVLFTDEATGGKVRRKLVLRAQGLCNAGFPGKTKYLGSFEPDEEFEFEIPVRSCGTPIIDARLTFAGRRHRTTVLLTHHDDLSVIEGGLRAPTDVWGALEAELVVTFADDERTRASLRLLFDVRPPTGGAASPRSVIAGDAGRVRFSLPASGAYEVLEGDSRLRASIEDGELMCDVAWSADDLVSLAHGTPAIARVAVRTDDGLMRYRVVGRAEGEEPMQLVVPH
jgi:hypothetical protein